MNPLSPHSCFRKLIIDFYFMKKYKILTNETEQKRFVRVVAPE